MHDEFFRRAVAVLLMMLHLCFGGRSVCRAEIAKIQHRASFLFCFRCAFRLSRLRRGRSRAPEESEADRAEISREPRTPFRRRRAFGYFKAFRLHAVHLPINLFQKWGIRIERPEKISFGFHGACPVPVPFAFRPVIEAIFLIPCRNRQTNGRKRKGLDYFSFLLLPCSRSEYPLMPNVVDILESQSLVRQSVWHLIGRIVFLHGRRVFEGEQRVVYQSVLPYRVANDVWGIARRTSPRHHAEEAFGEIPLIVPNTAKKNFNGRTPIETRAVIRVVPSLFLLFSGRQKRHPIPIRD